VTLINLLRYPTIWHANNLPTLGEGTHVSLGIIALLHI